MTFTATVSTIEPALPAPPPAPATGSVEFFDGTSPIGSAPLNGNGQASFTDSNLSVGTHTITAQYGGDTNYSPSTSGPLSQVVNAPSIVAPTVLNVQRFGFHEQPTSIVLTFSTALDAATAQNLANFTIVVLGGTGKGGSAIGHVIHLGSATYNAGLQTVTLLPTHKMDLHNVYRLTIHGSSPGGVAGSTGLLLDGKNNGMPGSDYVAQITDKSLAGPAGAALNLARHASAPHPKPAIERPRASAVDVLAAHGNLTAGKAVSHPLERSTAALSLILALPDPNSSKKKS